MSKYISQLSRSDILFYENSKNRVVKNITMTSGRKWVQYFEDNEEIEAIKVEFFDMTTKKTGCFIYTDFEAKTEDKKTVFQEQKAYQEYMTKLFDKHQVVVVKDLRYTDIETSEIRDIKYIKGEKRPFVVEVQDLPREKNGDYKTDCSKFFAEKREYVVKGKSVKATKQTLLPC